MKDIEIAKTVNQIKESKFPTKKKHKLSKLQKAYSKAKIISIDSLNN